MERPVRDWDVIEIGAGRFRARLRVLFENRAVLAVDKPAGWVLGPVGGHQRSRNLQAALEDALAARRGGGRSRHLKFLRFIHRLDADTTGVLLFAKSSGAIRPYSQLFQTRAVSKTYLAVVRGRPSQEAWTCDLPLSDSASPRARVEVDERRGKEAVTRFRRLHTRESGALVRSVIEAVPLTGRTHQIRVHLATRGWPVLGDRLYGDAPPAPRSECGPGGKARNEGPGDQGPFPLALRAVRLAFNDPFERTPIVIEAGSDLFLKHFGFGEASQKP